MGGSGRFDGIRGVADAKMMDGGVSDDSLEVRHGSRLSGRDQEVRKRPNQSAGPISWTVGGEHRGGLEGADNARKICRTAWNPAIRGHNHHNPKGIDPLRGAMPKLRIEGLERDLDVPKGANLNEACRKSHVNLFWSQWARVFNCRGIGLCGACPVRVLEGAGKLHAPTKKEVKRLRNRPEDFRLACQVKVEGDLRIEPFPLKSIKQELGKEPLRRAQMEPEEREELFQKDRKARLEARRVKVEEFLETRKKRRSRIARFFTKRFKKSGSEGQEDKKKDGKKKGGGFATRLRKKDQGGQGAKKKPASEAEEKKGKKAGRGEGNGEGGLKMGKRGKKKAAAEREGGKRGGG